MSDGHLLRSVWVVFVLVVFLLGVVGVVVGSIWLWWPEWATERWARRSLGRRASLEATPARCSGLGMHNLPEGVDLGSMCAWCGRTRYQLLVEQGVRA